MRSSMAAVRAPLRRSRSRGVGSQLVIRMKPEPLEVICCPIQFLPDPNRARDTDPNAWRTKFLRRRQKPSEAGHPEKWILPPQASPT